MAGQELVSKMHELVKGVGMAVTHKPARSGEVAAPLSDPAEILPLAHQASKAFSAAIAAGYRDPEGVYKSWSPAFRERYPLLASKSPQNRMMEQWTAALNQQLSDAIGKNISLTSPLATGLVPFDLVAP